MYFTINLAFTNYLDVFPNLTDSLTLIRDKTSYEQPLPIHLNVPHYDSSLNNRPTKLKDILNNYINTNTKEIFDLEQMHAIHTSLPYENFFLNQIVNIFTFTSSIISIITVTFIYLFCKHKHIRTIVASLILYKAKEVEANSKLNTETDNPECGTLAYTGMALTLKPEDIKVKRHYLWDTLEINWNGMKLTLNGNKIDLPKIITIKIWDKIRVRRMINWEPLNFHVMIKQGITWYNLETEVVTV